LSPFVPVPPEVCDALRGEPQVGADNEPAYLLLTTNPDGAPYVCLLSRAQLAADAETVRAVVYSSGTKANLDRNGIACLVVVAGGAAHYCTLAVLRQVSAGRLTGYVMAVHDHRRDEVPGARLRGLHYTVTERMPSDEDWTSTRRLLDDMGGE
jgi:hypothetical protein